MQIFRNTLMLHTEKGAMAGWCALNDRDGYTEVQVMLQNAPQGQMEVILFVEEGQHKLGIIESNGKNAKKSWRFDGRTRDVRGVRIAHLTLHYIVEGGKPRQNAPLQSPKPKESPKAQKEEAIPIPVQIEPVPKQKVERQQPPAARKVSTSAEKPNKKKTMLAQTEMRLCREKRGTNTQPQQTANEPQIDRMLAQSDMRLCGNTVKDHVVRKAPVQQRRQGKPCKQQSRKVPHPPAAPGSMEEPVASERIQELMNHAQPMEALESPLPLCPLQDPREGVKSAATPKSNSQAPPELIEVLALSDVSNCGVEDGFLGEGSGRKGVLGKGVWWRVEQPGVQNWHYLAGELTAKDGKRVRAIALCAECGELPVHLNGWAQKIDEYFIVLIDAKTGNMLPGDAC